MDKSNSTMKPIMIHLHIPKTGGTTINSILDRNHSSEQILPIGNWAQFFDGDYLHKPKDPLVTLIMGHFDWGLCTMYNPSPKVISFFREPVARLTSLYYYWANRPPDAPLGPGEIEASNKTFRDWATSEENWIVKNNEMCRIISGLPRREFDSQLIYETALEHLEEMVFIGIFDQFAKSISLMCETLDLLPPMNIGNLNQSTILLEDRLISDEIRDILIRQNTYDTLLYEKAVKLFSNRSLKPT